MARNRRDVLRSLAIILPGYVIAVCVAVAITVALYLAPTALPDDGRWGSIYREARDLPGYFLVGGMYTTITAWPGYLATLYHAHRKERHTLQFYCVGGVLTALVAHFMFAVLAKGGFLADRSLLPVVFCSIPGGIGGAAAFFWWRKTILSATANDSASQAT